MLERAYIRFRENLPDNPNTYAAAEGFSILGIPIVPFYGFGDINLANMPDLGPEAIVCGNIGDVWEALTLLRIQIPPPLDYPEHLEWMLGRTIVPKTLGEVRGLVDCKFVKPVKQKLFCGLVWDPKDPRCRIALAPYHDDTPCLVSDIVDFVSEWRCLVRDGVPIAMKHYRGDWSVAPDRNVFNKAIKQSKGKMPAAYGLDFGVTSDGKTLLVEANEGYAIGHYGANSVGYARFLEARWMQLVGAA